MIFFSNQGIMFQIFFDELIFRGEKNTHLFRESKMITPAVTALRITNN